MKHIESLGLPSVVEVFHATSIVQRYRSLPLHRSLDDFVHETSVMGELSRSIGAIFRDLGMSPVERYNLSLFARVRIEHQRALEDIASDARRDQLREIDIFRNKMVAADRTFDDYSRIIAEQRPANRFQVYDWFVRMRMEGIHVGDMLYEPMAHDSRQVVLTAAKDVQARRIPSFELTIPELNGMLAAAGSRLLDETRLYIPSPATISKV